MTSNLGHSFFAKWKKFFKLQKFNPSYRNILSLDPWGMKQPVPASLSFLLLKPGVRKLKFNCFLSNPLTALKLTIWLNLTIPRFRHLESWPSFHLTWLTILLGTIMAVSVLCSFWFSFPHWGEGRAERLSQQQQQKLLSYLQWAVRDCSSSLFLYCLLARSGELPFRT